LGRGRDDGVSQTIADAGSTRGAGDLAPPEGTNLVQDAGPHAGSGPQVPEMTLPPGATPPAWVAMLPGHYAVRAALFTEDQRVVIRWNELAYVDIQRAGDQLEALVTPCSERAETASGLSSGGRGVSTLATRRHRVNITSNNFSLVPIEVAIGYDDAQPAACDGQVGKTVMKRPLQTWIRGDVCQCTVEEPPAADDCRVNDPDGDNRPGYTTKLQTVTGAATVWGVTEDRSSYVNGQVGEAGAHTALYQLNEQGAEYGCEGALCDAPTNSIDCAVEYNHAQFALLDRLATPPGGWGCAAVVERVSTLFPAAAPAFPRTCSP
jgi:hypothetical protein